jgi:hypothetical protein
MSVIIPLGVCVFCRMPLLKVQTPCQSSNLAQGPLGVRGLASTLMSERRTLRDGPGVVLKELNRCAWR